MRIYLISDLPFIPLKDRVPHFRAVHHHPVITLFAEKGYNNSTEQEKGCLTSIHHFFKTV